MSEKVNTIKVPAKVPTPSIEERDIPSPPDLRQSLCHTLMALGFFMLNKLGPYAPGKSESQFHYWIVLALGVVVVLSWYFFVKRLKAWRQVPSELKARFTRQPSELKQRAISHLLMSLLALTLTALAFLPYTFYADFESLKLKDFFIISAGAFVGIISVAVLSRTVRDLITVRQFSK